MLMLLILAYLFQTQYSTHILDIEKKIYMIFLKKQFIMLKVPRYKAKY